MTADNIDSRKSKKTRNDDILPPDPKNFQVQRRRVWRACESCRRKKIKCDGQEPRCGQCTSNNLQCTWLQTKDRAALSRHYVQELESRLLHMETIFTQITPVLEQIGQPADGASSQSASSQQPAVISPSSASLIQSVLPMVLEIKGKASDSAGESQPKNDEGTGESFDQLALDEHGHLRWIGGSSTMSLIQSFRALTVSPANRVSPMEDDPRAPGPNANKLYFPASVFFGRVRALPGPEEVEYPERDLADKLVNTYFSRFHFLLPVLDKPSFLRNYNYLMQHTRNPTPAGIETAFISLVFAVFACAARFVEDPRLSTGQDDDGGMGMVYYERALILHYITHASIQVSHVQIFTLMSAFLCSVNCLPQAWLLTGQAVRSAQDLGLHRSSRRLSISSVDKETHRKIWWGVYTLDRMLALALGRPLGIADSDCDVELPVDVEDEALPEYFSGAEISSKQPSLMAGFIALASLYKIGGRVLRKVYAIEVWREALDEAGKEDMLRAVEVFDRDLMKWCDDLPVVFKSAPVTDQQVSLGAVLCSHYYSVLTTLHRNFLPGKRDQPLIPQSTARALSSARACIRLAPSMKDVVPSSLHSTLFLQNLFSSAVIILLYAMHVPDPQASNAAMDEARGCLDAIGSWEGSWPGARKCKELLLELTNTASEAIKKSTNEGKKTSVPAPAPPPTSRSESSHRRHPSSQSRPARRKARSRDVRHVREEDEAQRNRSTSRKRPLDDDGPAHSPIRTNPYPPASPYSPYARRSHTVSSHSSPRSPQSVPSPTPLAESALDTSMTMEQPPFSPTSEQRSPTQQMNSNVAFEYNLNSMSPQNSMSPPWEGPTGEQGIYGRNAQDSTLPYSFGSYGFDSSTFAFDELSAGGMGMMDPSPPSENFTASGLPFRGLDFIRNYTTDGYLGDQAGWQTFDTGAFIHDPDMLFSLSHESNGDGQAFSNGGSN